MASVTCSRIAGHDVLQGTPFGRVIEHVAGGDERHARRAGECHKAGEAPRIVAAIAHAGAEPDLRRFAQRLEESGQRVFPSGGGRAFQALRHDDEVEPLRMGEEVVAADEALALLGAALAEGEEPGQPAPCGAAFGIGENVRRAVAEHEPGAGRERQARFLRRLVGAHHAGHRVAVGDADARRGRAPCPASPAPLRGRPRAGTRSWW